MAIRTEVKTKDVRYISFVDFKKEDADFLKKKYGFHELDLEDCLEKRNEIPKIDEYKKYLFMILQVPYFDKKSESVEISEVNMFIGKDFLIMNHDDKSDFIKNLEKDLKKPKGKKDYMVNGTGYFLYKIVEGFFDTRLKVITYLKKEVGILEKEIFHTNEMRDRLEDILFLKKSIITLRRCIGPQRSVISQLEHKNKKFLKEDLEIYFDDVVDTIEKIWQNLEILKETVETLELTNESLISHYTNNTMRLLAIISVTMLPLTFVTGLYGMNIPLPFQDDPQAFLIVISGMFLLIIFILIFFRFKRWI